ncbi:MAG: pullulanase-associated domain-containing protein [Candidatus Promineifilaceae bacterium]|nr:pullulanase-associated domain-containing protein [Candidatus Promineifilaceae bacterium]
MANKNRNLIIAYFPSNKKAEQAAKDLKHWDKQRGDVKLGGIGIITEDEDGNLKTRKVGAYATGTGAKWGIILGAAAGILSGGITVIGGALAGLAGGAVAGALFHKRIGMTDEDKDRLLQHLSDGGAALAVMADEDEVESTKFQLGSLGGEVESYNMPDDAVDELEVAAAEEGVDDQEEVVVVREQEENDAGRAAAAVATTAAVAATEALNKDDDTQAEPFEANESPTEGIDSAAEMGAAAAVVSAAVEEENVDQEPDRVTIHYRRYNEDYDGWGIHVWTGYEGEATWENPLPPAGKDDFGIYFKVPVAPDAQGLAYIIHRWDEKDLWDDQYLDFEAHGREVWIVQNMPGYVPAPE